MCIQVVVSSINASMVFIPLFFLYAHHFKILNNPAFSFVLPQNNFHVSQEI
jgi:hypothetical protein